MEECFSLFQEGSLETAGTDALGLGMTRGQQQRGPSRGIPQRNRPALYFRLSPPGPQSSAGLENTQILSPLHSLSGKCEKTGPRSALKPLPLPRLCLLSICLALELALKCLEWSLNQGPCPRGIANQLWALGKPPASNSASAKWNLKYCLPARG